MQQHWFIFACLSWSHFVVTVPLVVLPDSRINLTRILEYDQDHSDNFPFSIVLKNTMIAVYVPFPSEYIEIQKGDEMYLIVNGVVQAHPWVSKGHCTTATAAIYNCQPGNATVSAVFVNVAGIPFAGTMNFTFPLDSTYCDKVNAAAFEFTDFIFLQGKHLTSNLQVACSLQKQQQTMMSPPSEKLRIQMHNESLLLEWNLDTMDPSILNNATHLFMQINGERTKFWEKSFETGLALLLSQSFTGEDVHFRDNEVVVALGRKDDRVKMGAQVLVCAKLSVFVDMDDLLTLRHHQPYEPRKKSPFSTQLKIDRMQKSSRET